MVLWQHFTLPIASDWIARGFEPIICEQGILVEAQHAWGCLGVLRCDNCNPDRAAIVVRKCKGSSPRRGTSRSCWPQAVLCCHVKFLGLMHILVGGSETDPLFSTRFQEIRYRRSTRTNVYQSSAGRLDARDAMTSMIADLPL